MGVHHHDERMADPDDAPRARAVRQGAAPEEVDQKARRLLIQAEILRVDQEGRWMEADVDPSGRGPEGDGEG